MLFSRDKLKMIEPSEALAGRDAPSFIVPEVHEVLGTRIKPPFPDNMQTAVFGLGCFWGAERLFWQLEGVHTTAVGYSGGYTPHPTYEEVCTGKTGHAEVVLVVFDPAIISYGDLLKEFFEAHDPTQGMRQGNDVGTQYRSVIQYTNDDQKLAAVEALARYQAALAERGFGPVTTEVLAEEPFFYAEDYHQQYLHKVPNGYCGLAGTGVTCPVPNRGA